MFVKTEFISKYYFPEACRDNMFNVIQGRTGEKVVKTWASKYNFYGFSQLMSILSMYIYRSAVNKC